MLYVCVGWGFFNSLLDFGRKALQFVGLASDDNTTLQSKSHLRK